MDHQSVSSKMDSRIVQFKKKNSCKISYLCCGPGNRIHKNNVEYTEVHIFSFSPTGTSSTSTTLTRKPTMRKSQRYSMSVVQDKHQKSDIPMWVCFHSFIHCVDYPNVVLGPVSLFHEDEVREKRLRISNQYKNTNCRDEYDSVLFKYNSTIAESIQINGKHVYIVVLCQNIGIGNADLRA